MLWQCQVEYVVKVVLQVYLAKIQQELVKVLALKLLHPLEILYWICVYLPVLMVGLLEMILDNVY